jgi:hypothetical protein
MGDDGDPFAADFGERRDVPEDDKSGTSGTNSGQQGAAGQGAGQQQQTPPHPQPQPPPALPDIMLVGGNLLAAIEQAERAILAAPTQYLFQRAGMLVRLKRIAEKTTTKGITRDAGSLIIAEATPECVRLGWHVRRVIGSGTSGRERRWKPIH